MQLPNIYIPFNSGLTENVSRTTNYICILAVASSTAATHVWEPPKDQCLTWLKV